MSYLHISSQIEHSDKCEEFKITTAITENIHSANADPLPGFPPISKLWDLAPSDSIDLLVNCILWQLSIIYKSSFSITGKIHSEVVDPTERFPPVFFLNSSQTFLHYLWSIESYLLDDYNHRSSSAAVASFTPATALNIFQFGQI